MPGESAVTEPAAPPRRPVAQHAFLKRSRSLVARVGWPEAGVAGLTLAFIAITAWWLAVDQTTPDGDASRHLHVVFDFHDQLLANHELYWFRYEPSTGAVYPPLTFLIGMVPTFITGLSVDGPILALNLTFLPLLTFGCYGVARQVFGRAAGFLAAVFALATPVVIGQFHLFLLDLPLTGMVAATAWAVLASERFANRKLAIVAGVLVGLGLLTKQSFVLFVGPLIALVLLRGGFRSWRNLLIFGVIAGIIAVPWYVQHLDGLTRVAQEATAQSGGADTNPYGPEYTRGSLENYAWQGWTMVNTHYFLPLALFFVVGLVSAIATWVRTREAGYLPELILGSLGGYLGIALVFGFQDSRYSIPALVFVAALATGWIATARRPLRIAAVAMLAVLLVVNSLAINTSAFGFVQIVLPGANDQREFAENRLVVFDTHGYTGAQPERAPRTLDLLEAAKREGVPAFSYDSSPWTIDRLGAPGLFVFSRAAGLPVVPGDQLKPGGIYLAGRPVPAGGPRPCQRFEDGTGLYVFKGVPGNPEPTRRSRLTCPL
jgi:4-amino-4-deoxy-L-arabinose transferase-like glycosyltransferase